MRIRELKRLTSSGLVNVALIGKRKHYQADPVSPVFDELCGLVLKTVAMVPPIRQALEPLADRVSLAPVYGSVAKGTHTASSDIDVLLAGFNMSQGASDIPALDQSSGPGGLDLNTAYPQGYLASTEDRSVVLPILRTRSGKDFQFGMICIWSRQSIN